MEKKTETGETVTPCSLETVRLLLRPFQEEDAEVFFACCQNPNLGNNAGWAPHKTIEESREILQNVFIGQENIWAMTLKNTQQLIGSIGIVPDLKRENPQVRMLGYWLDEAYWGKGYMTACCAGCTQLRVQRTATQPHHRQLLPAQQAVSAGARTERFYL